MRVVIAPDSFKGSLPAKEVAEALARGWHQERPRDELHLLPMADGGEGTLDAILAGNDDAEDVEIDRVTGPDGRPSPGRFVLLADGTAVLEVASTSGLPMMASLDPLGATTCGLGELLAAALDHGARRLLIGLGGSATSDAAMGALRVLGLRAIDDLGRPIGEGGAALQRLVRVDATGLRPAPYGGVQILSDVDSPLLGPTGAAAVFGPQKGADQEQIAILERGLGRLAAIAGGDPDAPGAGAAGGAGYGFATFWGAELRRGSEAIAEITGLDAQLRTCDLAITGEGQLDATSLRGKVPGYVADRCLATGRAFAIVAGTVSLAPQHQPTPAVLSTTDLAGSTAASLDDPAHWLVVAGAQLARDHGQEHA